MVKIILDGRNKIFYTKCVNCATEFEYQLSDVETEKTEDKVFNEIKTVKCPVCGEKESATLLTKEEYEKIFSHYYYGGYCRVC